MDANLNAILEVALQQGIWAALYIYLFFRMLKENVTREERYQQMIDRIKVTEDSQCAERAAKEQRTPVLFLHLWYNMIFA